MPKMPGREPVQVKLPIDRIAMASFFMPWEGRYLKRKCIVEGCDHRIGNCVVENSQPGIGVDLEQYEKDHEEGRMRAKSGPVCEHCVNLILDSR